MTTSTTMSSAPSTVTAAMARLRRRLAVQVVRRGRRTWTRGSASFSSRSVVLRRQTNRGGSTPCMIRSTGRTSSWRHGTDQTHSGSVATFELNVHNHEDDSVAVLAHANRRYLSALRIPSSRHSSTVRSSRPSAREPPVLRPGRLAGFAGPNEPLG